MRAVVIGAQGISWIALPRSKQFPSMYPTRKGKSNRIKIQYQCIWTLRIRQIQKSFQNLREIWYDLITQVASRLWDRARDQQLSTQELVELFPAARGRAATVQCCASRFTMDPMVGSYRPQMENDREITWVRFLANQWSWGSCHTR